MTNWLISSNPRKFQLAEFLRKYEYVDWKQGNTKFKVVYPSQKGESYRMIL